jgi:hypothetical protein
LQPRYGDHTDRAVRHPRDHPTRWLQGFLPDKAMEILTPIKIGAGRLDGGGGWRNTEGSEASAMTQLAGPLKDWSAFYFLHGSLRCGEHARALLGEPKRDVLRQCEVTPAHFNLENWNRQFAAMPCLAKRIDRREGKDLCDR